MRFNVFQTIKSIYKQSLPVFVAAVMVVSNPLSSYAAPSFTNYPNSTSHSSATLVTAIDGALWYLQSPNSNPSVNHITRMTTSGAITSFDIPALTGKPTLVVSSITAGSDGNIWFSGRLSAGTSVYVGRLAIATGAVTLYTTGVLSNTTSQIAASSDGKLWFYSKYSGSPAEARLQKFDIATGATTTTNIFDTYTNLTGIAAGHDGRIWLTDAYYKRIYALNTTTTTMSTYNVVPVTGPITWLHSITAGPDGDMWFRTNSAVYRFPIASSNPSLYTPPTGVPTETIPTTGPDGAHWFLDTINKKIVRTSITGNVTAYTIPGSSVDFPSNLMAGPDGAMWFGYRESGVWKMGRLVIEPDFTSYPTSTSHASTSRVTTIDGSLWYLQTPTSNPSVYHIGRMTTSGAITNYDIPALTGLSNFVVKSITAGPDGNVWFNGQTGSSVRAGRLNITTGVVTTFGTWVSGNNLGDIVAGSDGNLWYYNKYNGAPANTYLLKLDPSTGTTTTAVTYDTYTNLTGIAAGSDGRIWLTDTYYKRVDAQGTTVTPGSSSYNVVPVTGSISYLGSLASGPGGDLWMRADNTVYKFKIGVGLSAYTPPAGAPMSIPIAGPDGASWFRSSGDKMGRISSSGSVTEYTVPGSSVSGLGNLTAGPDNAIWFSYLESGVRKMGRLGY